MIEFIVPWWVWLISIAIPVLIVIYCIATCCLVAKYLEGESDDSAQ